MDGFFPPAHDCDSHGRCCPGRQAHRITSPSRLSSASGFWKMSLRFRARPRWLCGSCAPEHEPPACSRSASMLLQVVQKITKPSPTRQAENPECHQRWPFFLRGGYSGQQPSVAVVISIIAGRKRKRRPRIKWDRYRRPGFSGFCSLFLPPPLQSLPAPWRGKRFLVPHPGHSISRTQRRGLDRLLHSFLSGRDGKFNRRCGNGERAFPTYRFQVWFQLPPDARGHITPNAPYPFRPPRMKRFCRA